MTAVDAGILLGYVISAATALAAGFGVRAWRGLDGGGRWIVRGLLISTAFIPIMLWGVYQLGNTRRINEVSTLVETSLALVAFIHWQPTPARRRILVGVLMGFVVFWSVAQWVQGTSSPFSYLSAPVASLVRVGAAGYTLTGRVQATHERWTDQPWFWLAIGVIVHSGTSALLDPVWTTLFGVRADLYVPTFVIYTLGNVLGYSLMIRGFLAAGKAGG